jgi:hypothetical protein
MIILPKPRSFAGETGERDQTGDLHEFLTETLPGAPHRLYASLASNTRHVFNPACYGTVFPPGQPPPASYFFQEAGGMNTGFGGEVFVHRGLAVGGEIGYAAPQWNFSGSSALGMLSPDVSYHFLGRGNRRKVDPFVIGGYTLYVGDRTATQSGFNLWATKHAALRLEVRNQDHIASFHSQSTHFVAFRIGATFR